MNFINQQSQNFQNEVFVNGIDKIWAADLVDMQAFSKFNHGARFLLTVTDTISKYGWMLPLKYKTGKSVANTMRGIFRMPKWDPEKLWTDKGKQFYNKHVEELGVELYWDREKSLMVKCCNRTMKEWMHKYFTAKKNTEIDWHHWPFCWRVHLKTFINQNDSSWSK